jgi:hypothetical protein
MVARIELRGRARLDRDARARAVMSGCHSAYPGGHRHSEGAADQDRTAARPSRPEPREPGEQQLIQLGRRCRRLQVAQSPQLTQRRVKNVARCGLQFVDGCDSGTPGCPWVRYVIVHLGVVIVGRPYAVTPCSITIWRSFRTGRCWSCFTAPGDRPMTVATYFTERSATTRRTRTSRWSAGRSRSSSTTRAVPSNSIASCSAEAAERRSDATSY